MAEFLQSLLALIVTISILVTVHEFGHFYVARLCGVHVERFSVGFGRAIFRFYGREPEPLELGSYSDQDVTPQTRSNETLPSTEYCLAMIPLGGYVKMLDERDTFVPDDLKPFAFNRKPLLQRTMIVAAGPVANFVLAFFLYWILFASGVTGLVPTLGQLPEDQAAYQAGLRAQDEIVSVDGRDTPTWADVNLALFDRLGDSGQIEFGIRRPDGAGLSTVEVPIRLFLAGADEPKPAQFLGLSLLRPEIPPVLGEIMPESPAARAGLLAGDRIIKGDGQALPTWGSFVRFIQDRAEASVLLEVRRGEAEIYLTVEPEAQRVDGKRLGRIGVGLGQVEWPKEMQREIVQPLYWAWYPALAKTADMIQFTFESIWKMLQGLVSTKNLSGPVTIAKIANQTAESGLESYLTFIALVSISLGVLNLLPIPMLDGGHLLYFLVEGLTGRAVSEQVQGWGIQIGLVFLVGIMMLAFYNDLLRL
jgi:regulator of sigma E protease